MQTKEENGEEECGRASTAGERSRAQVTNASAEREDQEGGKSLKW